MNIFLNTMDGQGNITKAFKGSVPTGSTYNTMRALLSNVARALFGMEWKSGADSQCLIPFYVIGTGPNELSTITIE